MMEVLKEILLKVEKKLFNTFCIMSKEETKNIFYDLPTKRQWKTS